MKRILFGLLLIFSVGANAQFSKATLQASGLTCSLCSKAVKTALEKVSFVEKVQVDIKNQQYNLTFKQDNRVDFDALGKAVEDAGFSVAFLKVTATVNNLLAQKDDHVKMGAHTFHFLNSKDQALNGEVTFTLVDKAFVLAKDFKKYAAMTKMACVQSGRMESCCVKAGASTEGERIYHVTI